MKPEHGPWLVSGESIPASHDWQVSTLDIGMLTWGQLDIGTIEAIGARVRPAMNRVDSIGFTDLMAGGGIEDCSRVDWIEVWGHSAERLRPLPMREAP